MSENKPLIECLTIINSKLIPNYIYSKGGERTKILEEIRIISKKLKKLFEDRAWKDTKESLGSVDDLVSYLASIKEGEFDNKIKNKLNSYILTVEAYILGE